MRRIGLWLTEAAISGVPMIPLFIFVTSFITHEGDLLYVLPFVLFYSFNKTGDFMLEMFGTVRNPYRLAQLGAALVIAGAGVSLLGELALFFLDAGAVLIGLGTSIFGPMYRSLKELLRGRGRFYSGRPELVGFALMTVFSGLILFAQGRLEEVLIAAYLGLSVVCLLTLRSLAVDEDLRGRPLFDRATHNYKRGIPALLFLGVVLFVRLYKQTADVTTILWVLVLTTAVTVVVVVRQHYREHLIFEYHGVFYSEMLVFAILFDIFLFISQGDIMGVILANLCQFAGMFLAMAFGKRLLARFEGIRTSNVLVCVTMGLGALFLVPALNFCVMGLIGFATQLGHIRVSGLYHTERDLSPAELYLTNQKMINIGIVAGQAILVGVLTIASLVVLHNGPAAMEAYAFHIPADDLGSVFSLTKLWCLVIFWAQGIALLAMERRKWGSLFVERATSARH